MSTSKKKKLPRIEVFDFEPGRWLCGRYEIVEQLGYGWEGEVYLIRENVTGIDRAAKIFFPHRNEKNKTALAYAKKLHRLRHCPMVIGYYALEEFRYRGHQVGMIVSEYVDGEMLSDFLARQPGGRIPVFMALHLLHSLAEGLQAIHAAGEYHGDLHTGNIMVERYGLGFDLRLLDFFHWQAPKRENHQDDIVNAIKIFHEAIGGTRFYNRLPDEVKEICMGLKRSLIVKKYPRASRLKTYLETMAWD